MKGSGIVERLACIKEGEVLQENIREAYIEQQAVEFSMRLAIEGWSACSVDEMRELVERYEDATSSLDTVVREDFRLMPPEAQEKMREMLVAAGDGGRKILDILEKSALS